MHQGTRGEVSVHINATPERLYAMVSDVTRMGEWSPETVKCAWVVPATGPAVGARFKGTNKRGIIRWSTKPEVVSAESGREFAFVTSPKGASTKWVYRFEATADGGTDVSESFEFVGKPSAIVELVERLFLGIKDRTADLEAGMRRTLERLKAVAEA